MTTVSFDAYAVTTRFTDVNGEFEDETIGFDTVTIEFVIGDTTDRFEYEYTTADGWIDFIPNGASGRVYEIRIDGEVAVLESFFAAAQRVNWANTKTTDMVIFDAVVGDPPFDEETTYVIQLGGDRVNLNSIASADNWVDTIEQDADGDPITRDITSGAFAEGMSILYSAVDDYAGITQNDVLSSSSDVPEDYRLGSGNDVFTGDGSADKVYAGTGNDTVMSGGGNDRVYSGKGTDVIELGSGNDYVRVGGGKESFDGGSGTDYISYYDSTGGIKANLATNTVSGSWAVNDTINSFESISGSKNGADHITGTSGANVIKTYGGKDKVYAGKGSDRVELGSGNDYVKVGGGKESFDGGSGWDYISYYSSTGGILIDLRDNEVSRSWAVNDTIKNFEAASGSKTGSDTMLGTDGSNTFRGYGGDDKFYGRGGSDKMYGGDGKDFFDGGGGSGTDQMWGGADADVFHFDKGEGIDIVKDFENNIDEIQLDNFGISKADAFGFADQVGTDVVFDFGADGMLTIENVTIGQLQNDLVMV